MAHIFFDDKQIELNEGQSVLLGLLGHDYAIPNHCRAGVCQSCLMQAVDGDIPAAAQVGLKDTFKAQGYFLACCCQPNTPLHVMTANDLALRCPAEVVAHELINPDVLCLKLKPHSEFDYRAGQFISIWKNKNLTRSYSLASVKQLDESLELHIRRVPDGKVSGWLHDEVVVGDTLEIQAARGDCFYVADKIPHETPHNILLAGTGTGLAPLIGIARDAIAQKHRGKIHAYPVDSPPYYMW